ncbi:MAG: DUF1573 domain-containing protein [Phycisphaerales bacterium]|nr:DUF1573 domain-containing protein [Phycisphaerales bacterium]
MNATPNRFCLLTAALIGLAAGVAHGQAATGSEPAGHNHAHEPGHAGHNHAADPATAHRATGTGQVDPNTVGGPTAKSVLLFKETHVSTGEILDIESVPVEFKFKNTGSEDLEIQLVKPSCGCTVPDMEKTVYKPGESGVLKVTFDPTGKKGTVSRNITIYTNSSIKPVHTIFLQSEVKPVVLTEPRVLAFEMTNKGQSNTKDIKIYGRFPEFKVKRATTQDSDVFGIEIVDGGKVTKDGEDMWLQIVRVTLMESAKPDNYRTEVTIRTNEEHKSIFSMAVVGRVIGDLQLSPVRMTLGRLVVGDEFNNTVTLRSISGKPFEVKGVNSSNVVLNAEYTAEPIDAEKRNEWTIRVKGTVAHPAQRFNSEINVITDMADEEMVSIQVYGQLQPKPISQQSKTDSNQ